MDLIDLTGRHSAITTFGAPIISENGTAFDGNSCIFVSDGLADFAFGVGSYTVELDVSVAAPASYIAGNLVDFIAGSFGWSIRQLWTAQNAYDPVWIEVIPSGGFNYQFGAGMNTWASIAISYDATAGVTRFFKTGILVATIAGQPDLPLNAPRLTVGAEGRTFGSSSAVFPFIGSLRNLRITKAARYTADYTPEDFATGDSDPYWSSTVLLLPLVKQPPSQRVTIDSMTADTAPGGDWTTYDGSAGRVVSGSISAALADGQSVTVSFDGGATWVTATTSGLSWSIIDPGEHVTSWIIVARVSAGTQSGPVTVRSVSLVPPPAEIENPYPPLVTSEHAVRPRFMATVEALTRPLVSAQSLIAAMPAAFDLDVAEGVQLDAVGLWVGRSRYLSIPISGAWFSFDVAGLGFDEGTWKGPFDATTGISRLDDGPYRLLLKARIAANQWDGTRQGAVDAWSVMFDGTGVTFQIQDNADMSMDVLVYTDHPLDAVTTALITGGYLGIKPSGVTINSYTITEV